MLFLAALLPVTVFAHGHGHDRLIRRHAHLEKRAPLNCTTYDYQTPASLSAGSLNSTQGCGATYTAAAGDVRDLGFKGALMHANQTVLLFHYRQ